MKGYNEMLRKIEPENIICYHEPFEEMKGNIIYVNYELSSWQHMEEDIALEPPQKNEKSFYIKKHYGYIIQMGAGSAHGGTWIPSTPEDERFFGKPGEIIETTDRRGNMRQTKIGEDGRAITERHNTTHGSPKYHSNPHDHELVYKEDGSPDWPGGKRINYWDGDIPEFKRYERMKNMSTENSYTYESLKERGILDQDFEDYRFKSIAEFQNNVRRGSEIVFVWNQKTYGIGGTQVDGKAYIYFGETYNDIDDGSDLFESSEEVLNQVIDGKKLREIITEVLVVERTL